jgi:hypothetical protein
MSLRRTALGLSFVVFATACGGGDGGDPADDTLAPTTNQTINGTVSVPVDTAGTAGEACEAGSGEFSDVTDGVRVTVSDESGEELGEGTIDAGTYSEDTADPACVFPFTVVDVTPATSYVISIGDRALGTFTQAQISSLVQIELG